MALTKKCECCGSEFRTNQSKAKYCSRSCQQKMYLARKKEGNSNDFIYVTYPDGEKKELYMESTRYYKWLQDTAERNNWGYEANNNNVKFYELPERKGIRVNEIQELEKNFNLTKEQSLQARIIQLEYKLKGMEQMHQNELVHLKAMHEAELKRKDQEIQKIRDDKEAENTQKLISGLLGGGLFNNQIE